MMLSQEANNHFHMILKESFANEGAKCHNQAVGYIEWLLTTLVGVIRKGTENIKVNQEYMVYIIGKDK